MAEPFPVNEMLADAYEPKRTNRWLFQFPEDTLPAFVARTAALPSFSVEPIVIDFLNAKRYLQGKFEWNTLSIGLYDPIDPSSSQRVMEWARLGYENLSGRAGYAAFYKKDFKMFALDPVGVPVEEWEIQGAFLTDVTFGDLSMDSAEPRTIELTVRPDRCILRY